MKIAFNARTLATDQVRGWSRYTSHLITELSNLGVDLYLFTDREINQSLLSQANQKKIQVVRKSGFSYIDWEQRVLPKLCSQHKIDILHCPINYGLPLFKQCKQVLSLHDAIEVAFYGQNKTFKECLNTRSLYMRALYKISQLASDAIITVSHHAKSDLIKYYSLPEDKIHVIYEASDLPVDKSDSYGFKNPYFFYVGGFEERKNIPFLIEAFAKLSKLNVDLVLAGGGDTSSLQALVEDLGIKERVHFTGWVEDKNLYNLYKHAHAFVYPSYYEGFGLQIVEAMSADCPVLCSDKTSLPEIYGFKDGTFDPNDISSLVQLMERSFNDKFYQQLKEWSAKRKDKFSWEKTARQTLTVYESLLE